LRLSKPALLRAASATLLLSGVAGLLLPFPEQPVTARAETPLHTIPFTDINPVGANFFLSREVEGWKKEQTMKMAQEAGIGWIKEIFAWEEIEPRKGYFYNDRYRVSTWAKYDEIVALAERYGLRVIARLDRPPTWSRRDNRLDTAPPDKLSDYVDFVAEVVKRYKGRVQFFQVWNEPNIYPEWGERPPDPAGYVEMLRAVSTRAKEIDPNVVILSAPLAQTLEVSDRNLNELDYLDGMYKAGAKGAFDILTANAYGFEYPPDAPADPKVLNFSRLKLLREVMERHGDHDRPIWFNEFGWNASPADFPQDRLVWRRVSDEEQAKYTVEAIKLARSWGWAGVVNIWFFRQVGDIPPERSDYFFRMVDTDFTPRPVYHAVRQLSETLRIAAPGTVQELHPAVITTGRWSLRLAPEASGGVMMQAASADARLSFTFEGTDAALVTTTGPKGGRFFVTVDDKDPNLPTKDGSGRSVLDLAAPQTAWMQKLPIARGLRPGKHTVTLEPAMPPADSELLVDAFEVENNAAGGAPGLGQCLASLDWAQG
jgi:hypothetical protein